jgi:hypothetical protein
MTFAEYELDDKRMVQWAFTRMAQKYCLSIFRREGDDADFHIT